ncbi:Hypothetical_protein [Hexamita inflata]|uniref:Hypothetical_protein n=1 Tax=Hexamita inflata TaxID=28002 RepID=A0AA86NMT8_9EUKA|nr:Hypothetical protein HINF_LOCUS9365 [Hexamita inflata]
MTEFMQFAKSSEKLSEAFESNKDFVVFFEELSAAYNEIGDSEIIKNVNVVISKNKQLFNTYVTKFLQDSIMQAQAAQPLFKAYFDQPSILNRNRLQNIIQLLDDSFCFTLIMMLMNIKELSKEQYKNFSLINMTIVEFPTTDNTILLQQNAFHILFKLKSNNAECFNKFCEFNNFLIDLEQDKSLKPIKLNGCFGYISNDNHLYNQPNVKLFLLKANQELVQKMGEQQKLLFNLAVNIK